MNTLYSCDESNATSPYEIPDKVKQRLATCEEAMGASPWARMAPSAETDELSILTCLRWLERDYTDRLNDFLNLIELPGENPVYRQDRFYELLKSHRADLRALIAWTYHTWKYDPAVEHHVTNRALQEVKAHHQTPPPTTEASQLPDLTELRRALADSPDSETIARVTDTLTDYVKRLEAAREQTDK